MSSDAYHYIFVVCNSELKSVVDLTWTCMLVLSTCCKVKNSQYPQLHPDLIFETSKNVTRRTNQK